MEDVVEKPGACLFNPGENLSRCSQNGAESIRGHRHRNSRPISDDGLFLLPMKLKIAPFRSTSLIRAHHPPARSCIAEGPPFPDAHRQPGPIKYGVAADNVSESGMHSLMIRESRGHSQSYSIRATPFPGFGNRTNTSGSCPGMINRGLVASCFIRSCAARFDLASSVAVIGTCLSRFSYR